ncbi:FAS1 domain-containing protein [Microthyrium microscopicum]|uniref:FAS1 domain-containing protein n=1 Tax=Microthyrium microscopicum TaxID=703497 RepID=A0A6A6TU49_9PEZI|nr:FAS1 domain-containing protein [Microthyrium microscopicum]
MKLQSVLLTTIGLASAQDLLSALSGYPDTSTFATYIPEIANDLNTTAGQKYTVLIPSNEAFTKFAARHGAIDTLPADTRKAYLRYHVLASSLTSTNFSQPQGLTVPTLLTDTKFNNRSAGDALTKIYGERAAGQVLYIAKNVNATSGYAYRVRRQSSGNTEVRGGLASDSQLTAIDGTWSGGTFQLIDTVLEPPLACSKTIRSIPALVSLDNALNRSSIWPALDTSRNVTCLAPDKQAFAAAGDADANLNKANLVNALLFHTLPLPVYSSFASDGMEFKSLGNLTVRVTVNLTGMWFNDAKVKEMNVLTNNWVIHVLDKVMSPIDGEKLPNTGNGTGNGTSVGSGGKTGEATSTRSMLEIQWYLAMVICLAFGLSLI